MKQLLESIKKRCFQCSPDNTLANCSNAECQFWAFLNTFLKDPSEKGVIGDNRHSKSVHLLGVKKKVTKTAIYKLIKSYCLECCGESPLEVANCCSRRCGLWPYRFGREPNKTCTILDQIEKQALADPVESIALDIFNDE